MFQRCVGEEVLVLGKSNSRDCEDLAEFASSEETMAISFSNQPYAEASRKIMKVKTYLRAMRMKVSA